MPAIKRRPVRVYSGEVARASRGTMRTSPVGWPTLSSCSAHPPGTPFCRLSLHKCVHRELPPPRAPPQPTQPHTFMPNPPNHGARTFMPRSANMTRSSVMSMWPLPSASYLSNNRRRTACVAEVTAACGCSNARRPPSPPSSLPPSNDARDATAAPPSVASASIRIIVAKRTRPDASALLRTAACRAAVASIAAAEKT